MSLPEPPVNVQLVLYDGTKIAVDTVYAGVVDGTHEWHIVQGPPFEQIKMMSIDKLPPRTAVALSEGYTGA